MSDFKNLIVWQRSREVTRAVYQVTRGFPRDELHGLTSQLRRAAISVSANIAEGSSRFGVRDQARCYRIGYSSANEVEALLIVAVDIDVLKAEEYARISSLCREVQKMLSAMIRRCLEPP